MLWITESSLAYISQCYNYYEAISAIWNNIRLILCRNIRKIIEGINKTYTLQMGRNNKWLLVESDVDGNSYVIGS